MLASTMLIGAALAAAPAFAQAPPGQSGTVTSGASAPSSAASPATADQATVGPNVGSVGSTSDAGGAPASPQEVVVTGSRIRSPNLTSNSPLTVVSSQEVKFEGVTNVDQLLNRLPQVTAGQTQNQSNGADGTANVNLRNLGDTRTLVLVDGKRLQPGSPVNPAADINNIPPQLIDRIDIVTGGASAVYGSDAVAGVVNFITKKNFQGAQIDAQYSFFNHENGNKNDAALTAFGIPKPSNVDGDGQTWSTSILLGVNSPDDKGNITLYANYENLKPVTEATRDFSACGLSSTTTSLVCQGSSNSAFGRFGGFANNPDGTKTFVAYTGALAFNFGPYNYLQRNDDRYNAGFIGHYKINDKIEIYSNFMFMDDHTDAVIAPSGLFRGTGPAGSSQFKINCDNPLIGDAAGANGLSQRQNLCGAGVTSAAAGVGQTTSQTIGYRFAGLPRTDDLRHTDYKIDIGARGDLGQGWNYDAYLQYGTSLLSENYQNDVSTTKTQDALLVRNVNGVPTCISGNAGCAPLDIFQAQSKGLTPAALAYVVTPGFQSAQIIEQIASININGDLGQYGVKSPFASDGIGVALGVEYRRESLDYRVDNEFNTGDLAGQGGPRKGNAGSFDVYEIYGEANIPIVQNKPLIKNLSLDLGYRFSDYSTVGKTDTYKGELTYAPISDIRFRAAYNRAVRAPNVVELFTPTSVALGTFTDPCAIDSAADRPTATQAQCANLGVSAAQYAAAAAGNTATAISQCPSAQCGILTGGNTALKAEIADTYTGGVVFTPTFLRGFNASVDYFDITVNGFVGVIPPTLAVTKCEQTGDPFYCSLIHRDTNTGILYGANGYVVNTNLNTGLLRSRGVDVAASYTARLRDFHLPDVGSLIVSLTGTYTDELSTKSVPGEPQYNCRGQFGLTCGQPMPAWKHELRMTYNSPYNVALTAQWRHLSGSKNDAFSPNPETNQGGTYAGDAPDAKIGSYDYFDLAVTWKIRDDLAFRVGVNNVLDKDPPVVDSNAFGYSGPGNFGNGNTYPGTYDSLGRYIFMGVTANF